MFYFWFYEFICIPVWCLIVRFSYIYLFIYWFIYIYTLMYFPNFYGYTIVAHRWNYTTIKLTIYGIEKFDLFLFATILVETCNNAIVSEHARLKLPVYSLLKHKSLGNDAFLNSFFSGIAKSHAKYVKKGR